jgi:ADP-dependent NAD(P)H-hydrate dehydratase
MATRIIRVKTVPKLPRRQADGHKGTYGHVLVVGGSRGMGGSVSLAANAALRGGAGLVTFAAPEVIQPSIVPLCPCALSLPLECDRKGELAAGAARQILREHKYSVLAVGPGLAKGLPQQQLVRAAIGQDRPLVLDADGLNNLASIDRWPSLVRCEMILTPHPGEFSRLCGKDITDIQADRQGLALQAVREWSAAMPEAKEMVLVLKGAGTIVTDGRRVYVNDTGNPGMATGGTGDVLTGLTAALWAQLHDAFDAACLAVWAHGMAGDLAADELGQASLIASDLLDYLPYALQEGSAGPD